MLYSAVCMESDHEFPAQLAHRLQQAGLGEFAALSLEAFGPMAPVASQLTLLVEPFLRGMGRPAHRLAQLLDDPSEMRELIALLRQES